MYGIKRLISASHTYIIRAAANHFPRLAFPSYRVPAALQVTATTATMSIQVVLDQRPEFYTNLDAVSGKVVLVLRKAEQIGNIVVKLEGEAITALQVPHPHQTDYSMKYGPLPGPPGSVVSENHKLLYKVQQVFPDDYYASSSNPYGAFPLHPGEHAFNFKFKLPINNACSDPMAMSKLGGLGSFGGPGLFGMGGVRVMDGSKQMFLKHATKTLPPSLTGFPMEAEIRYYIKVTVQRPGLLKENWRYQAGFKFLPIEPPRPTLTGQDGFARRPFAFKPRTPVHERKTSFFSRKGDKGDGQETSDSKSAGGPNGADAPSVEMSARLPHPPVLTCNKPIPLRLIAKKLAYCSDQVYLTSFEMSLIGVTEIRCHNIFNRKSNRWVVASKPNLQIPLTSSPNDEVGSELVVPDDIWRNVPLPNTIAPSFVTCNLTRKYELEIKLGLTWGEPPKTGGMFSKQTPQQPTTIYLPLHFSSVEVYSGIKPPVELVEAAAQSPPRRNASNAGPRLPPRTSVSGPSGSSQAARPAQPAHDPLYPPAENLSGPFDGLQERPAYSGVTNEDQPSQMPRGEKS